MVHPDVEQLRAFCDGRLGKDEAASVDAHLAVCELCQQLLEGIPDDDRLVGVLRSLPGDAQGTTAEAITEGVPVALAEHPRYEVLSVLGKGGMGVVYKARHRLMARDVALKVIRHRLASRTVAVERFRREIEAVATLDHPHVVKVYDAEKSDDLLFLVMEFVDGTDLMRLVRERGPLPVAEACGYAVQAARGLQHAHERGLIHRDMKPANLMLAPDGTVKVLDFGLATLLDRDEPQDHGAEPDADTPDASSLTALGRGLGTADYVAPEQAMDGTLADIRSDIYSLGATLYHLLAGRPPFGEGDASRRLLGHMVEAPRPLAETRQDVPVGLGRVLNRMMAKNPAERFQTPAEVADALATFADPARPHRRRFLRGLVAAGGLLTGTAGWLAWQGRHRFAQEVMRFERHPGPIQAVALSPDGNHVLTGCDDRRLRLFDMASGTLIRVIDAHEDWVVRVAFMPDGRHALSGSTDGSLRLWDMTTGQRIRHFGNHEATVLCVAVSPNGSRAVTGTDNRLVRVWEVETGRLLHRLEGHFGPVQCVAVSADGRLGFSGGNDRTVRVWDIDAGREVVKLEGHEHLVSDLLPLPGGRVLSGSLDKTTRLWSLTEGRQLATHGYPLRVARVLAHNDQHWAAGLDEDGVCRLYDAATGAEWCRLEGHKATLWDIVVTRDGRHAVTADRAGEVILWRLPTPAN